MDADARFGNPDYLAKDFESFRTLMLDHLAKVAPDWGERHVADLPVALVEVLAYVADYLSYYQDAVSAEAYLATARKRATVRRHARLVDYRLGEGCGARALVQLTPASDGVTVERGSALLPGVEGAGLRVFEAAYRDHDGEVFETMHDVVLFRDHTVMALDDSRAGPRRGETRLRLRGSLARLRPGDVVQLHHLESGFVHPVRLTGSEAAAVTTIAWHAGDDLPDDAPTGGTWVARGNLVLADHGRTCELPLPPMRPGTDHGPALPCGELSHAVPYDHAAACRAPASGLFAPDPAMAEPAMVLVEGARFDHGAASLSRAPWMARRDLLRARAGERVFVAEPGEDGLVVLRFGDGRHGRRPQPDWTYTARFRVGRGARGNVGPGTLRHLVAADDAGIVGVTNWQAAVGGVDPETLDHARASVPLARASPPFLSGGVLSGGPGPARRDDAPVRHGLVGPRGPGRPPRAEERPVPHRAPAASRILARLQRRAAGLPPLAALNTAVVGDLTNALMEAWARVCHVLLFYQERIAQEGFLPTAREAGSVLHLAGLIGVTRRPAVGAETCLVATLLEAKGQPASVVIEPGGLAVQDAPPQGRQPVVFESGGRIELRPEWNAIPLLAAAEAEPQRLRVGSNGLRLAGTATGVRAGKALLIRARGDAGPKSWLVFVEAVQVDRASESTLVTWAPALPQDAPVPDAASPAPRALPATVTEVTLFAGSAGLFGRLAPAWGDLPAAKQAAAAIRAGGLLALPLPPRSSSEPPDPTRGVWRSLPNDLPAPAAIRAMISTRSGALLAGTSKGVYRSTDEGASWSLAALATLTPDIHALHAAPDRLVYAGGARGLLFVSADDGLTWTLLPQTVAGPTTAGQGDTSLPARVLRSLRVGSEPVSVLPVSVLPATTLACTIRTITTWVSEVKPPTRPKPAAGPGTAPFPFPFPPSPNPVPLSPSEPSPEPSPGSATVPRSVRLCVGTDQGVYTRLVNDTAWTAFNAKLPRENGANGAADTVVWALLQTGPDLAAATSRGLFVTAGGGTAWVRCEAIPAAAFCLAPDGPDATTAALLVGTQDGVFRRPQGGPDASRVGTSLAGRSVSALAAHADGLFAATDAGLFHRGPALVSGRPRRRWAPCDTQAVDLFGLDDLFARALDDGQVPASLRRAFGTGGLALADHVAVTALEAAGTGRRVGWRLVEGPAAAAPVGTMGRSFDLLHDAGRLVVRQLLPAPGPASALLARGSRLLAAVPQGPPLNRDWPGFRISGGQVLLDRSVDGVESGGSMALAPAGDTTVADPAVYRVSGSATGARTAFGRTATVTEVTTAPDERLQLFGLRDTRVYLGSAPLTPLVTRIPSTTPITGETIAIPGLPGGVPAGRAILVSGPRYAATVVAMGGVTAIDGGPGDAALLQEAVQALAAAGGRVFAATSSGLVVERVPEGWRAAGDGLPAGAVVVALAAGPGGDVLLAGTARHGVFRRALAVPPGQRPADPWTPLGVSPAGSPVTALAVAPDGTVHAAGAFGVSRRPIAPPGAGAAPEWSPPAIGEPVHALAVGAAGRVFAGLDAGRVSSLAPGGADWAPMPPVPAAVSVLTVGGTGMVVAGLADGRVLYCGEAGWRPICRVPGGSAVGALLVAPGRIYLGSAGEGAFVWTVRDGLRPLAPWPSSVVLALAEAGEGTVLAGCDAAVRLAGAEPRVLRRALVVEAGADGQPALDQRMVAPSLAQAFSGVGATLSAEAAVTVIAPGARWLVRDRDRAWVAEWMPAGTRTVDAPATLRLFATDLFEVLAAPPDARHPWTIRLGGATGRFGAPEGAVVLQPARSDQEVVSEMAILAEVDARDPDRTVLTLAAPLRHAYDPAAAAICANVVPVTQGETVTDEILGSGNHAEPRQRFALQRSPVTHTRDADGAGVRSTLRVEVNSRATRALRFGAAHPAGDARGERWHHTASLLHHGPADRVYMVAVDEHGRSSLHFGAGLSGARLPTGDENVTASYRSGAGRDGNVAAGTLVALRKRPPGLRTVSNPMAATGGQDVQSIEDLRRRAPWQRLPPGRILSLADYAASAIGFPGIGEAAAQLLSARDGVPTVCVWATTEDGRSLDAVPKLAAALAAALSASRSDDLALVVGGFALRPFRVAVRVAAGGTVDPSDLAGRVRDALAARFGEARRGADETVAPDAVGTLLRDLPGVLEAGVEALHLTGQPADVVDLRPAPARWEEGRLVPAELLTLAPADILVTVTPA